MSYEYGSWTFLTNHAHVLVCVLRDPYVRMRDVAAQVGITERAVQRIVADLERAGAIHKDKDGRRNRYEVDLSAPLRHPIESHRTVGDLLRLIALAEQTPTAPVNLGSLVLA